MISPKLHLRCLIVLQKSGIPIYSNYYNYFCIQRTELLSGFLAAITQLPLAFGTGNELKSIELGDTKLVFSSTKTSKIVIVAGFPTASFQYSSNMKIIDRFFKSVEKLVEECLFHNTFSKPSNNELEIFEQLLLKECILPSFSVFQRNVESSRRGRYLCFPNTDQFNTVLGSTCDFYENPRKKVLLD